MRNLSVRETTMAFEEGLRLAVRVSSPRDAFHKPQVKARKVTRTIVTDYAFSLVQQSARDVAGKQLNEGFDLRIALLGTGMLAQYGRELLARPFANKVAVSQFQPAPGEIDSMGPMTGRASFLINAVRVNNLGNGLR
jgi:hypothetical protein